uniref:Uncharacterized protein n=1 Tax=Sinocyclocheilus grahami TaxID=75366 RepID=A0A672KL43_SINGR
VYRKSSFYACSLLIGFQTLIILDVIPYTDTSETTLQRVIWGENVNYYFFLQSNQAAGGSIVKGLGKQKIGAICNLVGYYAVGFPTGIFLMFAAKWGIFGLWTGLLISVFLQSVFLSVLLFKLNWKKASEEVRNIGFPFIKSAQEDGGYIEGCDANNATDMGGLVDEQTDALVATVKVQLPLSVLVLRRGLVLAAMLALLAAGLIVKFFLKRSTYRTTTFCYKFDCII